MIRKVGTLTLVAFLGAGAAFAGSLFVPWFLDNGSTGTLGIPTVPGTASAFITITNTTASPITCTIFYHLPTGEDVTPASNTFTLQAYSAVSFRPAVDDSGAGGTEGPASILVPNMASGNKGSARMTWSGGTAKDIQGRVAQILSGGHALAYLLPEGF